MKAIQVIGETTISLHTEAVKRRDALVSDAKSITEIESDFDMDCAAGAMRKLKECSKSVEDCRTEVKSPVLEAGRRIDQLAKDYIAPVLAEESRIRGLMNSYAAEQKRRADEAERARQAELRRIERERQEAEAAERRKAEEARLAAEAVQRAKDEAETAFTVDEARLAAEREQKAKADAETAVAAAEHERQRQAELAAEQKTKSMPVAVAKPQGVTVKEVWKFEVLNVRDVYASAPNLCRVEVVSSLVNDAIRAGTREIPGLRIYSVTETVVR